MKGGARPGAGRKPKADELQLIERLSPLDDLAFKAIREGVKAKDYQYLKLFMDYRFGKPKEKVEHSGGLDILWQEYKTYEADKETDGSS